MAGVACPVEMPARPRLTGWSARSNSGADLIYSRSYERAGVPQEVSMGNVRLTVDLGGTTWQDGVDPSRIGELLADRSNLVWIDVRDPGPAEIETLRRELGLHELALDYVVKIDQHQRPRCDRY